MPAPTTSRFWSVVAAAWVLSIGVDFFLHAGLLARVYLEPSPFLLDPLTAFRRIPVGYLAFLMLTASLGWLVGRLGVRGAGAGLRVGLLSGGVVWGALALGLYSISTASWPLLLGWWVGQAVELGLAGAVIGAAAGGVPAGTIWRWAILAVVGAVVLTVIAQSLGWAPPMQMA